MNTRKAGDSGRRRSEDPPRLPDSSEVSEGANVGTLINPCSQQIFIGYLLGAGGYNGKQVLLKIMAWRKDIEQNAVPV